MTINSQELQTAYRKWILNLANKWCSEYGEYSSLIRYLYSVEYVPSMANDENRAKDGEDFRLRFADEFCDLTYRDIYMYLTEPCTLLEMMMALACRCEDHIMGDPSEADHSGKWFFEMIKSLGLDKMDDRRFDPKYVENVIDIFNNRTYERNGKGGLFTVRNPSLDMRGAEIWWQLNWYLSEKY